jgi:hypothetical protein
MADALPAPVGTPTPLKPKLNPHAASFSFLLSPAAKSFELPPSPSPAPLPLPRTVWMPAPLLSLTPAAFFPPRRRYPLGQLLDLQARADCRALPEGLQDR